MTTKTQSVQQLGRLGALTLATALALSACGGGASEAKSQQQQKGAAARAAHIPEVGVVVVQAQNILLENDLPARLESVRSATIVPQVSGLVLRRLFEEGSYVKAGQALYQIDGDSYTSAKESAEGSLATARASVLSAQATLAKANADVARYQPLAKADAISKQEWDSALTAKRAAEAKLEAAQASIKTAQANIKSAQLNLNRTKITAPISGFIGTSLVTEGALVSAGQTPMAVIQQNDPLYINITQSANDMLKLRQQLATGEKVLNDGRIEVGITLEDGSVYPHKGHLLFADPSVDEKTGQVTMRGVVPNPERMLMKGLYVRVKLPLAGVLNAFAVPQQAVTRGQPDTVMVVTADGAIQPRPVKIAGQKADAWIVSEGLQTGDRVVVDGTMIAGMLQAKTVKAVERRMTATGAVAPIEQPSAPSPAGQAQEQQQQAEQNAQAEKKAQAEQAHSDKAHAQSSEQKATE